MPEADAIRWFTSRSEYDAAVRPGLSRRREVERAVAAEPLRDGLCLACGERVAFVVPSGSFFDGNPDLREGWRCPECDCNNRQRLLVHALRELAAPITAPRVYLAEAFSPLAVLARSQSWQLTLSDYVSPDRRSGQTVSVNGHSVVHQDLTRTSFDAAQFDVVAHAEVLEHVPGWRSLLAETARITRPGGWTVFTVPFLHDRETSLVRAELHRAGLLRKQQLRHVLPPEVHGAPLHPEGVLVYQVPGWDLLDELRIAGFREARVGWLSAPELGITSNNSDHPNYMEPVVFAARR